MALIPEYRLSVRDSRINIRRPGPERHSVHHLERRGYSTAAVIGKARKCHEAVVVNRPGNSGDHAEASGVPGTNDPFTISPGRPGQPGMRPPTPEPRVRESLRPRTGGSRCHRAVSGEDESAGDVVRPGVRRGG